MKAEKISEFWFIMYPEGRSFATTENLLFNIYNY